MTFRVGQKVVVVKNGKRLPEHTQISIPVGTVCTIREIDTRCIERHGMATFRLVEYVNETQNTRLGPWELGYRPDAFRPIVERKTSIEIFTRMLKPQTTERRLDAVLHDHGFDPPK